MRILVVGGGYLGEKVRASLAKHPAFTVAVVGRRQSAQGGRLDISDPATFSAMQGFDVVINCSDAIRSPPFAAAEACLREGRTFIETSAHPGTVEQFLLRRKQLAAQAQPLPGLVIVGMGIFPGVSNLLARQLSQRVGKPERLEMGVRLKAFSGGGSGMVNQMLDSLFEPAIRYEQGQRVQDEPISPGIQVPFSDGLHGSVRVGLPESIMLHWSAGVPNTATYLSLRPSFVMLGIRMLSWLGTHSGSFVRKAVVALTRGSLLAIRRVLFRGRPTPVQLTIIANRMGSVHPAGETIEATCPDGVMAAGEALAAACRYLQARPTRSTGILLPEEIFGEDFAQYLEETSIKLLLPASAAPAA